MYDMPCICGGCNEVVELNDMRRDPYGPTGTELVCPQCARVRQAELDAEDEASEPE
jgi:hypothetical protein